MLESLEGRGRLAGATLLSRRFRTDAQPSKLESASRSMLAHTMRPVAGAFAAVAQERHAHNALRARAHRNGARNRHGHPGGGSSLQQRRAARASAEALQLRRAHLPVVR